MNSEVVSYLIDLLVKCGVSILSFIIRYRFR